MEILAALGWFSLVVPLLILSLIIYIVTLSPFGCISTEHKWYENLTGKLFSSLAWLVLIWLWYQWLSVPTIG